jgi:hypothetical protein
METHKHLASATAAASACQVEPVKLLAQCGKNGNK